MKNLAPWFMASGGAIFTLVTAIAAANGALSGKAPVAPYLYGYAVGLLMFVTGFILYFFLDEDSPNVAPVRYGTTAVSPRQINGQWCKADGTPFTTDEMLKSQHLARWRGLVVVNDSEHPAYEVHVANGKLGISAAIFDGHISRLTKNDGEELFPIVLELEGCGAILEGLFSEMKEQNVTALPVKIRYKNSRGRRYETTCKIITDAREVHGLGITDVHRRRDLFGF
jgi:hypothetical protein